MSSDAIGWDVHLSKELVEHRDGGMRTSFEMLPGLTVHSKSIEGARRQVSRIFAGLGVDETGFHINIQERRISSRKG
jgi:hypothetical protein